MPLLLCVWVRAALCTAWMVVSYWLTMARKYLHARTAALLVLGPSSGWFLAATARISRASSSGDRLGSASGAGALRAVPWTGASFARGKWSGIGSFGCNRHPSKKYMPNEYELALGVATGRTNARNVIFCCPPFLPLPFVHYRYLIPGGICTGRFAQQR